MAKLLGNGAPTSNTYGILGQEYIDKLTGKRYVCTKSATVTSNKAGEADHYCEWSEESAGGVSSWNDLTDKPFGEIVKNDTLVVDWDTFVPEVKETLTTQYVKVSDVVPTLDDFVNGASYASKYSAKDEKIHYEYIVNSYNKFGCFYLLWQIAVIPHDNFVVNDDAEGFTLTFPEKGIYFTENNTIRFTINGFDGFPNSTAVKQIDKMYLPGNFRVFFDNASSAKIKVTDGTYKFENTMVVSTTNVPGNGVVLLYPTHRAQDDTFTYTSFPYWSESDSKYIVNVEQCLGSDHGVNEGSIANAVVHLSTEQ